MSYAPFPLVWGFFGSGGGGGGGGPAFGVIQTDFGTYPTASSTTDVLTIVSADSSKYYFTGTALTDTVTLTVLGLMPTGGSTSQVLKKQSATNYDAIWGNLTKSDVGLGNVDNISLTAQNLASKEPTGFPNRTDSGISFDEFTRTFFIAATGAQFDVWVKGTNYIFSSGLAVGKQISTTSGVHYIYFDSSGSIQETTTFSPSLFTDNAMCAIVYWNNTNSTAPYVADERHGMQMDGASQVYLHTVFGTRYLTGLALQGFDPDNNTPTNASAQFTSDSGTIRDEDILHTLAAQTQIPILYKSGTLWRKKAADAYPIIYNGTAGYTGTRVPYNQLVAGNWQLTEVTDGNYVMVHLFATNDINNGVVGIIGNNQYANAPQARAAADTEINSLSDLPFAEFTAIGTVIFQTQTSYTNTPKARVVSSNPSIGEVYIDFRGEQLYTPSGVATSHSLLSNLSSDDHTQYHNDARGDARYVQLTGGVMSGTLETPTLKTDTIQNKTATAFSVNTTEPSVGAGTVDINITTGNTTGVSGPVSLKSGNGDSSGNILIQSGDATNSSSGGLELKTGDSTSGPFTGDLFIRTGASNSGNSGGIYLYPGIAGLGFDRGPIQFDSPNINFQNWTLKLVGTPSTSDEAANKLYVDTGLALKEDVLTKGNLTETTSSVLTITGGTNSVIGSGTTIEVIQSNAAQSGYLSNTDWQSFSNRLSYKGSIAYVTPVVANTVPSAFGTATPSVTGTASAVTPTFTTFYTTKKILEYTATALSSAIAGWRMPAEYVGRGSSANVGGFKFSTRFAFQAGFASGGTNRRVFCGLTDSTVAPTDVNPSSLGTSQGMFGVGLDNGDANFQIMHSSGSAVATKVNLGTAFARPTADKNKFYQLDIHLPPNSSSFTYTFTELISGDTTSGTISTSVPNAGVALSPRCWVSAGGVSSAVGLAMEYIYLES